MAGSFYQKFRLKVEKVVEMLPDSASYVAKRFEDSFKLITPGILFEEMGIEYIGPVDGHDIESLIETMNIAKEMQKPVIIHAQTTKGKGYEYAEGSKEHWHGVGAFDLQTGNSLKSSSTKPSATSIFANKLVELADNDEKIVGVTAAMPSGTGLNLAMQKYSDRFWDVAIAEQHAVTSMGALAKEGFKPFCAIYSTFLQRGYDQVIHDVALMDVGVAFAIDRAGLVGEDGETHQGVFDISYLRAIPNMTLLAPCNEQSLQKVMEFATSYDKPCAFRYPRGAFIAPDTEVADYELGKSELISDGKDMLFIGYGNGVGRAMETASRLELDFDIAVLDLRFVKPLDEDMLKKLAMRFKKWYVFSDSAKIGGVGSALLEFLSQNSIKDIELQTFEYEDRFIQHGNTRLVEEDLGILPAQLALKIKDDFS
jgi:1-deoxy-D-xylulose-5-phosphate synthase